MQSVMVGIRNKRSLHAAIVGVGNSYMGCIALGTRYLNLLTWPVIHNCFILIMTSHNSYIQIMILDKIIV